MTTIFSKPVIKNVNSFGIALCSRNKNGEPIVLLVNRKNTYPFMDFVNSNYNTKNLRELISMLDKMTKKEKESIMTSISTIPNPDFDVIWEKAWYKCCFPYVPSIFKKLYKFNKKKFFNIYNNQINKDMLISLIQNSRNVKLEWEIPKGRKKSNETDHETAIREFEEETNVNLQNFNLLFDVDPFIISNKDKGIFWHNTIYIGYIDYKLIDKAYLKDNNIIQTSEICDLKWFSMKDIINMNDSFEINGKYIKYTNKYEYDTRVLYSLPRLCQIIFKKYNSLVHDEIV